MSGGTKKKPRKQCRDIWCPYRDSNQAYPEYESEASPLEPTSSANDDRRHVMDAFRDYYSPLNSGFYEAMKKVTGAS
jgi:hypothetical protein